MEAIFSLSSDQVYLSIVVKYTILDIPFPVAVEFIVLHCGDIALFSPKAIESGFI